MARSVQHNSRDEVAGYLAGALAIVNELELTDELLPIAFAKAVDLLAAKQLFVEPGDVSPVARAALSRFKA